MSSSGEANNSRAERKERQAALRRLYTEIRRAKRAGVIVAMPDRASRTGELRAIWIQPVK
jgi:hypothetical protein